MYVKSYVVQCNWEKVYEYVDWLLVLCDKYLIEEVQCQVVEMEVKYQFLNYEKENELLCIIGEEWEQ